MKIFPSHRFTPAILKQSVPNVAVIVDLTATTRYYNSSVGFSFLLSHLNIHVERFFFFIGIYQQRHRVCKN